VFELERNLLTRTKLGFYYPYQLLIYALQSSFYTMSSTHVFLSLLCHHLMYPFCLLRHYSIIRMKMNRYITPLLRSHLHDISIRFPRQSNSRNSGGVWVFLMELFTRSWSSLYDFLSTFPSPFFERLTSPFNKVLKFVTSLPRVEYLFYLLYVGLGSRVDNSII